MWFFFCFCIIISSSNKVVVLVISIEGFWKIVRIDFDILVCDYFKFKVCFGNFFQCFVQFVRVMFVYCLIDKDIYFDQFFIGWYKRLDFNFNRFLGSRQFDFFEMFWYLIKVFNQGFCKFLCIYFLVGISFIVKVIGMNIIFQCM